MSHRYFCPLIELSLDRVENLAMQEMELGNFPTLIFISEDLYVELQKTFATQTRYSIPSHQPGLQNIMSIHTSAGSLNVRPIRRLKNFLLVGRQEDFDAFTYQGIDPIFWNDQERVRIDKAFEDLVILEGEDV